MKIRVTIDAQTFEVEVGDLSARPVPVTVDGETFLVMPEENGTPMAAAGHPAANSLPAAKEPLQAPAARPAPANGAAGARALAAPIPGVIISVAVKEGQQVAFGQELCVLEAMKMKNIIRASRAGTIGAIRVAAGDQVKHGQVLMEYSD
jgi:biotin carboxyl carrier protein